MDRLDRVSIAAPCSADWDSMPGTDRVRHCSQCNKNVYNLSAMMAFSSTASAQSPLIQINPAQARQSTFSISGDVIDITGVAVPNAHVTVSHQGSAEKLVIQASDKGTFRLDYL